jgi:hypothetical protein
MKSTDKAGVQFPDSESTLLPFVASMYVVAVIVREVEVAETNSSFAHGSNVGFLLDSSMI